MMTRPTWHPSHLLLLLGLPALPALTASAAAVSATGRELALAADTTLCIGLPEGAEPGASLSLMPCEQTPTPVAESVDGGLHFGEAGCLGLDDASPAATLKPCAAPFTEPNQRFVSTIGSVLLANTDVCLSAATDWSADATLAFAPCDASNPGQAFVWRDRSATASAASAAAADDSAGASDIVSPPSNDAAGPVEPAVSAGEPVASASAEAPEAAEPEPPVDEATEAAAPEPPADEATEAAAPEPPIDEAAPGASSSSSAGQDQGEGDAFTGSGTFNGFAYIALDDFLHDHPVLLGLRQDCIDAASAVGIALPPVLLAAIAMEESSGFPAVPGGLMQFTYAPTWAAYGQGDINNARDSLFAAARYLKDLLAQHGGDLAASLRAYNGDANPQYVEQIAAWLRGEYPYGEGT